MALKTNNSKSILAKISFKSVLESFSKTNKSTVKNIVLELEELIYLEKLTEDLMHHWKILKNLTKTVKKISDHPTTEDSFKNMKKEVGFLLDDLSKIKTADKLIKSLSLKIIEIYENLPNKQNDDLLSLINIEKQELTLTEKRVLNLITNQDDEMAKVLKQLNKLALFNKFNSENRDKILEILGLITIPLRQIFIQTQAIIKLEEKLKVEKSVSEKLLMEVADT